MDTKQAKQIGIAGLVFSLISFVAIITLGVYVLYYTPDKTTDDKTTYATATYVAAPTAPRQPLPPPRALNIPPPPPSGPVGSFFDDELPQA
jgi:hypothetical protein